jgi:lysophospholipase L1-like esterase
VFFRKLIFRLFLSRVQQQRLSQFEVLQPLVRPGDVVFLGDSITEGGAWHEWFPGLPVRNRGIGGDTTEGVISRLHHVLNHPSKVFLLIGTNDVTMGVKDGDIVANLEQIVATVRSSCPGTAVYVQSLLPRNTKRAAHLQRLNAQYAQVAAEHGATFVDLWPSFADAEQQLRSEHTNDHLHLLGPGYAAWVRLLQPHLEEEVAA